MPDLIPFLKDSYYGFSDTGGNMIIKPRFRRAFFFSGPSALVEIKEKDTVRYVIINKKGEVVFWNPKAESLELLPCGKYFTVSETSQTDKGYKRMCRLYNVNGQFLKAFEGTKSLYISNVMDSVVFYQDNTGNAEMGYTEYKIFDLTQKRTVPQANKSKGYIILNDSLLLEPQKSGFILLGLKDHHFQPDPRFTGYIATDYQKPFIVLKDPKNKYCIANSEGRIILPAIYKSIKGHELGGDLSSAYSFSPVAVRREFICETSNKGITHHYLCNGLELKMHHEGNRKAVYKLSYFPGKSANMIRFRNGALTEPLFSNSILYSDTFNHYLMAGLKKARQIGGFEQWRLMDTLGRTIIDSFSGSYCGNGIYMIRGANGRYAFWKSGKYISPFIYNNYIRNESQTFVAPPPVNQAIENAIITVVIQQGNNVFGLLDTGGKPILNPIYHYIKPVGNGLFFVSGNKGMFYCSSSGMIYASDI